MARHQRLKRIAGMYRAVKAPQLAASFASRRTASFHWDDCSASFAIFGSKMLRPYVYPPSRDSLR